MDHINRGTCLSQKRTNGDLNSRLIWEKNGYGNTDWSCWTVELHNQKVTLRELEKILQNNQSWFLPEIKHIQICKIWKTKTCRSDENDRRIHVLKAEMKCIKKELNDN